MIILENEGGYLPEYSAFSLFFLLDQFNQQLVSSDTVFLQEEKKRGANSYFHKSV